MKIKAYAKINLVLGVNGKRADGYHEIDSVMQSVSLYDTVTIEKADKITVRCGDLSGDKNIAFRAAELFFETAGISSGADINIEKNIPYPAGLGGGSADAAAVLLGLNKLYAAGLSLKQLETAAVTLGADVPFFIRGGTQRAQGIGEILTTLKPLKGGYLVIAINGEKPSTGEMYRKLDGEKHENIDVTNAVSAAEQSDLKSLSKYCKNSFADVTGLYGIDGIIKDSNPLCVCLSGSGPSVFALYESKDAAKQGYELLKEKNIGCYTAEFVSESTETE